MSESLSSIFSSRFLLVPSAAFIVLSPALTSSEATAAVSFPSAGFTVFFSAFTELLSILSSSVLFSDAGAAVFDGDDDAVDAVRDVEGDVALGVCELDGVFDKIIDDLMQKVFIAVHLHGLQGIEPADVDLLFVDALFKREHGGEDGLGNIEIVWAELQLAVIDAGEI